MNRFDWHTINPSYAQTYDGFRGGFSPMSIRHILERAQADPHSAVIVDLACGTGAVFREMFGNSRLLLGVDPATPMLEQAKTLYLGKVPGLSLVCASGEQLPLTPGSVDLVTIGQAIHWFNLPNLFAEMRRVLRQGGWLAVLSRYSSPAGRLRALVERVQYPYTEEGRKGIPRWSNTNPPSNLLGLEQAGFIGYERVVFQHEVELTVEGYLQGMIDRSRRRSLATDDQPAFRAALEQELNKLAQNGILRETFFDFVFAARKA
jgi:ubiquinone/menaquinone biosynthesis C-methylase UbiE